MNRSSRTLIVGVLFVIAAVLSWRAITNNRERRELDAIEQLLDQELLRKREMAADLDHHRRELASLEARLAETRQKTSPDLDALKERFAPLGVTVHPGIAEDSARPISMIGSATATLSRVLPELARALEHVDVVRIEVHDTGWRTDFVAQLSVATSTPAGLPADPPSAWYGFLNSSEKSRIAEKRRELAELDQTLGPLVSYWDLERELNARLEKIEAAAQTRVDLMHLAIALFATEPRVFATGSLEHSQDGLRGGMIGRLARPIKDPDLIDLFKPDLSARIVRGYADTVEVSFQRH